MPGALALVQVMLVSDRAHAGVATKALPRPCLPAGPGPGLAPAPGTASFGRAMLPR